MPEPDPDPDAAEPDPDPDAADPDPDDPDPEPDAASVPRLRTSAPSSSPQAAKAATDTTARQANGMLRARRTQRVYHA